MAGAGDPALTAGPATTVGRAPGGSRSYPRDMRRRPRDQAPPAVVEVVLVEDDATRVPDAAPSGSTAGPASAGQRRLGIRTRLVAVLGAMALLGAGGVLQARHQADVAAALARNPALVRPLHAPPVERWSVPDAWVSGVGETGVLVTSPDGRLRAIDPATGSVRWGSAGSGDGSGWCGVLHPTPDGAGLTRTPTGAARATLAVCERGRWQLDGDGGRVRLTRATALDATTGAVLGERLLEGGLLLSDVVDGDLLHAWADAEGRVGVVRWDPRTGAARWEHRGDRRVTERRGNGARVLRGPGTVSFVGAGMLTVDLTTGRERAAPAQEGARDDVVGRAGDATVVVRVDPADGGARTQVVGPDGAVRLEVRGAALLPSVRVDAGAGVLLLPTADGDVVGVDATTGSPLWDGRPAWSGPAGEVTVLAELDGLAVLTDGAEATAVRLADGRERWRLPLAEVARLHAVTDGSVLALPLRDGTATGALVAVDVRTGTELWRTALPAGTKGVRPAHGLVLVETVEGVTALG